MRRRCGASAVAALAALAGLAAAPPAVAQEVQRLADACGAAGTGLRAACVEQALTFQATSALLGLAGAGGAALPGSSSTLGARLGRSPRIGLALRVGGVAASVPWVADTDGRGERGVFATGLQGTLGLGLFSGFSPLPTIGGVLSLDVHGTAGRVLLPGDAGFEEGVNVFGLGARLGLLRESFTLPGVTASLTRRWATEVRGGHPAYGQAAAFAADVTTTSVRAMVGKDLLALGLLAGVGWDRYDADGFIRARSRVAPSGGGATVGEARVEGFRSERTLFFAGASYTLLVLQLSAEAGWASGFNAVAGRQGAAYDPTEGRFFASLAARLTF